MRNSAKRVASLVFALSLAALAGRARGAEGAQDKTTTFDQRLESRVALFETNGRPFVRVVLDLASEFRLPLSLEYLDRNAVRRPLSLRLANATVRQILTKLVAQLPEYQLSVSPGVLDFYSPQARADKSNPLNAVIDDFSETGTLRMESLAIYQAMMSKAGKPCCQAGDVLESGDARPVALHFRDKKVYELLNQLVAKDGKSLWVCTTAPGRSPEPGVKPWEVYELGWTQFIMADLQKVFPPEKSP